MINPSDPPETSKLLAAAASHVDPMSGPVAIPKKFTTSTWHQNTSIWKLITETKDPFKVLLYDFMYHGPLPQKEAKLPLISSWQQRRYSHLLLHLPLFPRYFSSFIAWGGGGVLGASTLVIYKLTESHCYLCRQVGLPTRCRANDCTVHQHEDGLQLAPTRCICHIFHLVHHWRQDVIPADENTHCAIWIS